jgi:hypothetical protein
MDFELLLASPARLLSRSPALALPGVLTWIPEAAVLLLITAFISANPELLEPDVMALLLQNFSFTPAFLAPFAPLLAAGLVTGVAWVLITGFVGLVYCGIAQSASKPSLSDGFSFAKSRLKKYLGAWLAVALVASVTGAAVVLLALPLAGLVNSSPFVAVVLGMLLLFFALGALLFFSLLFWLLPALVAFRQASGFGAFSEFYGVARSRPSAVAVGFIAIAVVSFAAGQLTGALSALQVVGYAIAHVLFLPLTGWSSLVAALVVMKK